MDVENGTGSQTKGPEDVPSRLSQEGYDSGRFIAIARSQSLFRQQLPAVVGQLMAVPPLELESRQAMATQQLMYDAMSTLWNDSSEVIFMGIYGKFAVENGLEVETDTEYGKLTAAKPISDLSPDETTHWHTYLDTTEIPRQFAVKKIRSVLGYATLPSIKYIDDPVVDILHKRLGSVPYQVALTIFPDISDEEAKLLFGQLTSVDDVKKLAVDPTEEIPA